MKVFTYTSYDDILQSIAKTYTGERGFLSRLARSLGIHPSYVTRALRGEVQFTLEQGFALSQFLHFNEDETEYFTLLVQRSRAGSPEYKHTLDQKLESLRRKNRDLGNQFKDHTKSGDSISSYYSSWIFSAVHILLTIPGYTTPSKIAKKLYVEESIIEATLKQLEDLQLVKKTSGHWESTKNRVFLSNREISAHNYHQAWSQKVNEKAYPYETKNLRYTGVHSLSKRDAQKLKSLCSDFLQQVNAVVEPSKEEALVVLRLDLLDFEES